MGKSKQAGKLTALKTNARREKSNPKSPKRVSRGKPSGRRRSQPTVSPSNDGEFMAVAGIPDEADIDAATSALRGEDRKTFAEVRRLLAEHLGSHAAARLWLVSPGTGFATTALDAVRNGQAKVVLATLKSQWGPNPTYA